MKYIIIIGIILVVVWLGKSFLGERKRAASSTKVCKKCGSTIPFNASVCPYCRRTPGSDYKAENRVYGGQILKDMKWIIIIVLIVAVYVVVKLVFHIDLFDLFGGIFEK